MKKQNGNVLTIVLIYVAIIIAILLLIMAVFLGNVNSLLHRVKTDMYLWNRTAIVAVNHSRGARDSFSYQKKEFQKYFVEALQKEYGLNDSLENPNGLIQKVVVKEYDIYAKNQTDHFTGKKLEDKTIHTVLVVTVKPLIFEKAFEKVFTFEVHQDVKLEMVKYA